MIQVQEHHTTLTMNSVCKLLRLVIDIGTYVFVYFGDETAMVQNLIYTLPYYIPRKVQGIDSPC
jgi:hypothetical protein